MYTKIGRSSIMVSFTFLAWVTLQISLATRASQAQNSSDPKMLGHRSPTTAPMAVGKDLHVGITTTQDIARANKGDKAKRLIMAYVMNVSDHPVRIFVPGLVGPNTGPKEPPTDYWVIHEFGEGDFVVLRPGEMFGRRELLDFAPGNLALADAYYYMFEPGHEGSGRHGTGVVRWK